MVNTFLVDPDFDISASKLDNRRLGKQRVEAYQILNIIHDLRYLSDYYEHQLSEPSELKSWITTIRKKYKSELFSFVCKDNTVIKQNKPVDKNTKRVMSLGFCSHPAVRMWFYHSQALKYYINAHINEWISRGYKNTMTVYIIDEYTRPMWTYDTRLHLNHRSSLLNKEITRKERPWYQEKEEFMSCEPFENYIWPS